MMRIRSQKKTKRFVRRDKNTETKRMNTYNKKMMEQMKK